EDIDEIVAAISDIEIALGVNVAVFAESNRRAGGFVGGSGSCGCADDSQLLFLGIENRDPYVRRRKEIVFAVPPMPKGAQPRPDGREDPAAGHELIVHFRGCRSQGESE